MACDWIMGDFVCFPTTFKYIVDKKEISKEIIKKRKIVGVTIICYGAPAMVSEI